MSTFATILWCTPSIYLSYPFTTTIEVDNAFHTFDNNNATYTAQQQFKNITMQTDQRQEWVPEQLDRSSSPFNHHASFVPFPPSADDQPESTSDEPLTITIPNEASKTGYRHLVDALGYRIQIVTSREVHLMFADAVTLIEKLKVGKPITRRPRELIQDEIKARLQKLVPNRYLVNAYMSSEASGSIGLMNEDDVVAKAAAKYIGWLEFRKNVLNKGSTKQKEQIRVQHHDEPVREKSVNEEGLVEKTLDKIEAWCDSWLQGKIRDEDWDKMEEYV